MKKPRLPHALTCAILTILLTTTNALATWSILLVDEETGEVAAGTVTCLTSYDLLAIVPVVVVGTGAGAVQAAGDFAGIRRPIIFDELMAGTPPEDILTILSGVSGHQSRQYGIVDAQGRAITFTGASNGAWAGGAVGSVGSLHYAVQGNVLAGPCVVDAIVSVLETTSGDVPSKLMAAMQRARQRGGDGRCSCSSGNPTGCGCPPPSFSKSGHIGGMIVARIGDTDDTVCNASGCADGDYFMRLNVAFQPSGADDPVVQLQGQFDDWRAAHEGRPDAVRSMASIDPPSLPPDGASAAVMTITLLDWRDQPIDGAIESLTVEHAPGSAGLAAIGAVTDAGGGTFRVTLTAGAATGLDRFRVAVDDGIRPVVLMPDPVLRHAVPGDVDGDGVVDFGDLLAVLSNWGECAPPPDACPADLDDDGTVGFGDVLLVLSNWT